MKDQYSSSYKVSTIDLLRWQRRSRKVLRKLITKEGIYASTKSGWKGPYHSWFGRDSAITAELVFAAERLANKERLSMRAYSGLQFIARWQGKQNSRETGEELGKIPHEIRNTYGSVSEVQHSANINPKPWFVDPVDGLLKNWDSCDSTPLWIISMTRAHSALGKQYNQETLGRLKIALVWCLNNIQQYNGLVGFTAAELQPGRTYSGMHNQGWKDSLRIYQYGDGHLAAHPIKDFLINAETWAALKCGADIFNNRESSFSRQLDHAAKALKDRINDSKQGFLFDDETSGLKYFVHAIDGKSRKLKFVSADVGLALWSYFGDECAINKNLIDQVVKRLMKQDLLNLDAGMRNYILGSHFAHGIRYHGSPDTYWPFVSALIVRGLDHFGYKIEAQTVAAAMLRGIKNFDSCIELFVQTGKNSYSNWKHPEIEQQSSINQAWTAAGIYYATRYLLSTR